MLNQVRLVSNPREWVERESGEIHLWLAISQSLANKQVIIIVIIILFIIIAICIIIPPKHMKAA